MKMLITFLIFIGASAHASTEAYQCIDNLGQIFGAIEVRDTDASLIRWGGGTAPPVTYPLTSKSDNEIRIKYNSDRDIYLEKMGDDKYAYSFGWIDPTQDRYCKKMTPEALAQYASEVPKPAFVDTSLLVEVDDSCGYCGRHENYESSCTIDKQGIVKIERSKTHKSVSTESKKEFKIDASTLEELQSLVESSKTAVSRGEAKTYCGDAPSFSVTALPEGTDEFDVELYAEGKTRLDSRDARKLARMSARICEMSGRRTLWKMILSKMKM